MCAFEVMSEIVSATAALSAVRQHRPSHPLWNSILVRSVGLEACSARRRSRPRRRGPPPVVRGQGMSAAEAAQLQPAVAVSPLDFQVDQYVSIGSPNGLFLALRKARPLPWTALQTGGAPHIVYFKLNYFNQKKVQTHLQVHRSAGHGHPSGIPRIRERTGLQSGHGFAVRAAHERRRWSVCAPPSLAACLSSLEREVARRTVRRSTRGGGGASARRRLQS